MACVIRLLWQSNDSQQKYRGDDIALQVDQQGNGQQIQNVRTDKFNRAEEVYMHVSAFPQDKLKTWITILAKPHPKLVSKLHLKPAFYPNKKRLCEEMNRLLQPWGITFSVVVEHEDKRIQLTNLDSKYHLELKNGQIGRAHV
jgi:hypothetical protein